MGAAVTQLLILVKGKFGLSGLASHYTSGTMTCTTRRLGEGRRLSGPKGAFAYSVIVPMSYSVSASTAQTNWARATALTQAQIQAAATAANAGTISVSNIVMGTPTATTHANPNPSFASGQSLLVGLMLILRAMC